MLLEYMTAFCSLVSSDHHRMLLHLLHSLYSLGKNMGVFFFHSW
jgi:hypothetical protein